MSVCSETCEPTVLASHNVSFSLHMMCAWEDIPQFQFAVGFRLHIEGLCPPLDLINRAMRGKICQCSSAYQRKPQSQRAPQGSTQPLCLLPSHGPNAWIRLQAKSQSHKVPAVHLALAFQHTEGSAMWVAVSLLKGEKQKNLPTPLSENWFTVLLART